MSQLALPGRESSSELQDHSRLGLQPPPDHQLADTHAHAAATAASAQTPNLDYRPPENIPYTPTSPTNFSDFHSDQYGNVSDSYAQDSPTIGRPHTSGRSQRSTQSAPRPSPITVLPSGAFTSTSTSLGSSPSTPLSSTGAR